MAATGQIALEIGAGVRQPALDPQALFLRVADVQGSYTIPYIQSAPDVEVRAVFLDRRVDKVRFVLSGARGERAEGEATVTAPQIRFNGLLPDEYSLHASLRNDADREVASERITRIGVGTVIAALGDSITEGYYGPGVMLGNLELTAAMFFPAAVSRDGRNFPQFAPTSYLHLPSVNCFQSWMTELNDILAAQWKHPVFIANEGWGGITSQAYVERMRSDQNWQERMRWLKPSLWLLHLGVNDGRAFVVPGEYARHMSQLVEILLSEYKAGPDSIFIARPAYDYFENAAALLQKYNHEIDGLIRRYHLRDGADFFAAYAADRARWYGEDPVHPNVAGVSRMAKLWGETLLKALPKGAVHDR